LSQNSLFFDPDELLNAKLHKLGIEVYELWTPEDNSIYGDRYVYAIVKEINRHELEQIEKTGFKFYCISPYMNGKLWVQFIVRGDI
jgi:hypothetical protein